MILLCRKLDCQLPKSCHNFKELVSKLTLNSREKMSLSVINERTASDSGQNAFFQAVVKVADS